jgi:branched-chain amino acid transport system permease protein
LVMNKKWPVRNTVIIVCVCFLLVLPLFWKNVYAIHVLILAGINVLLAVSLRAQFRTGQVSLGTAGFMLVGAYASALLAKNMGLSFWISMPLGGLASAMIALIVGYPFLKAKGIYFAILTVLLAEVLRSTVSYWPSLTGGTSGLLDIPSPVLNIFGLTTITFDTKFSYYYLMLVIVIICLIILYRIEKSWLGSMWKAINESDNLAQAVGINIMGHRILNFSVTCFFMGIAGALYAHYTNILNPMGTPGNIFAFTTSMYVMTYVIVGGEKRFAGPIIGALFLTIVFHLSRMLGELEPLIYGALLILVVFFIPDGVISLYYLVPQWYYKIKNSMTKKTGQA